MSASELAKTMTKRYAILQKKLQELETQLSSDSQIPKQDIEQRLDFLNTLFSAETVSSPQSQPHLQHIGKRIALLESAFRECKTTPLDTQLDTVSDCSCTESCLNEDEIVDAEEKVSELGKERVRVRGATSLGAGMAVGFVIGMGVMGFMMRQCLFHCSPYAFGTMAMVPT